MTLPVGSTRRLRILAVTPWVPSKRRPRSLGLLAALNREHDLRLLASTWSTEDEADLEELPYPVCGVRSRRLPAMLRAIQALFSTRPLQQAYVDNPAMQRAIESAVSEFRPELIYFNTLRTAQWRHGLTGNAGNLTIDLDEFRSGYYRQVSRSSSNFVWRRIAGMECQRMEVEERRILADFESVLISSATELSSGSPNVHLVRSPHALSPGATTPKSPAPSIVFVGRLSYAANVEAVAWFCQHVMPAVVREVPGVQLNIVGDAPGRAVRSLAGPNVKVLGRVDSVDEHYLAAWVSIVPVTSATGVQMKVIEALDLGVPTVTTPLVAEQAGINSVEVAVALTASEWSARVIELLTSYEARQRLSDAGALWARQHYSAPAIGESLRCALFGTPTRARDRQ